MADNSRKIDILSNILYVLFKFQTYLTKMKPVDYKKISPCIYATWHAYQCAFYNIEDYRNLNVLISSSNDGEIIARVTEKLGLKVIRGSKGRGGTQATFKMLEKIEQGESVGITVDGPRGPKYVVKKGVINIAKISQVPIVPFVWHTDEINFLKFPTWDELRFPIFLAHPIVLYGEPIYVPADIDDEGIELYRKKVETALLELDARLKNNFNDFKKI